jgi:hypothetical protein
VSVVASQRLVCVVLLRGWAFVVGSRHASRGHSSPIAFADSEVMALTILCDGFDDTL